MSGANKTYQLMGIENKETFQVMHPDSGETHEYVAVDTISSTQILLVFPGVTVVPLSNNEVLAAPTPQSPNVASTFTGLNQPYPTNRLVLQKLLIIQPLVALTDREAASLQAAQVNITIGNNRLDSIDAGDLTTSRGRSHVCAPEGVRAMCEAGQDFGDNRVDDRAAIPAFIMSGQEDLRATLDSLQPEGNGFFVDPGRIDPFDEAQERVAYALKILFKGYYIARKGSMADNASRYRNMNMNAGQGANASMSGQRR